MQDLGKRIDTAQERHTHTPRFYQVVVDGKPTFLERLAAKPFEDEVSGVASLGKNIAGGYLLKGVLYQLTGTQLIWVLRYYFQIPQPLSQGVGFRFFNPCRGTSGSRRLNYYNLCRVKRFP